jgi:glycosyltransferase 2 family protein
MTSAAFDQTEPAQEASLLRIFADLRLLLSLGLALVLLAVFALRLDFGNLRHELQGANYGWVAAAVGANFVAQWCRAVRHHYLLVPIKKLSTGVLLGAVVIGAALNNVLPLRGGSVARVQLLARRFDISRTTLASTLAAELVLDTLMISIFLVIGISILHVSPLLGWLATVVLLAALAVVGLVWFLNRAVRGGLHSVEARLQFLPERIRRAASSGVLSFEEGWRAFWRAQHAIPLLLASAAIWLSEAISFFFFGLSVGLDLSFLSYTTLVSAADIATSLAFTPAGLGAFELSVSELLRQLGTTAAVAGAYVLMSHAVLTLSIMAVSPLAFIALKVRPGDILYLRRLPATEGAPINLPRA